MCSFKFNKVYLSNYYSIAGQNEKEGNIKNFDLITDNYFNQKTYEQAEIKMQDVVFKYLFNHNKLIDVVVGGDLQNQIVATDYMASNKNISTLGVYSACASFNEALIILASLIDGKKVKSGIALTSSHNLTSERQFRYPVEYGAPKKKKSTFTATGAAGCILQNRDSNIKVVGATIGKVVDYGVKDALNMGAAMAPSACDTLINHLHDFNIDENYYDLILTGDLGEVGASIFKDLLKRNNIKLKNHIDAGSIMYKKEQNLNAGSSGPVTLPLVLFNKILKENKYKKILLLATGALHSTTMVNQKQSIPGICHAISLEVLS